jgi:peptidoglycan/LPS O-acetylase OafA/YrhL
MSETARVDAIGVHAGPTAERNNHLNLVRFVLASLVIFSHSYPLVEGDASREPLHRISEDLTLGHLAVCGFFLLSGALIVQSWMREPSPIAFVWKRARRIYPGFIIASLVCAFVVGPLGANVEAYFEAFRTAPFLKGVFLLSMPAVPSVFEGSPFPVVNGSMWTISYEFRCYLLVLVLGTIGLMRDRRWWLGFAVAGWALDLAVRLGALPALSDRLAHMGTTRWTLELTVYFLVGGCYARYAERIRFEHRYALLAAISIALSLLNPALIHATMAIAGGYLLFYFAQLRAPRLAKFNRLPDMSYGIYLYGWPIQKLLVLYVVGIDVWAVFGLAWVAAIALGAMSWYLVEKPCLRLSLRRRSRTDEAVPVLS